MGYFLTTEPETAVPGNPFARPKTHGPGSRMSNLGLRFYSPEVGRWISRDSLDEVDGLNLYAHTHNDAVNQVDPNGLVATTSSSPGSWTIRSYDPEGIPDEYAQFDQAIDYLIPRAAIPSGQDQTWILTKNTVQRVREEGGKCIRDSFIAYTGDFWKKGSIGSVIPPEHDHIGYRAPEDMHFCMVKIFYERVIGFGSSAVSGQQNGRVNIDLPPSTFATLKIRIVGPSIEHVLFYRYRNRDRCPCCEEIYDRSEILVDQTQNLSWGGAF